MGTQDVIGGALASWVVYDIDGNRLIFNCMGSLPAPWAGATQYYRNLPSQMVCFVPHPFPVLRTVVDIWS